MLADPEDTQFLAAASGTAAEVKAAFSAGADPGARNEGGATPLHVAAMRNADPRGDRGPSRRRRRSWCPR